MRLLSPYEDFARHTLSSLDGGFARLCYLASLKDSQGRYRHWGLARTYGERVANELAAKAHREALQDVLRSPIPRLFRELRKNRSDLRRLRAQNQDLLPNGCTKAAAVHLKSVLFALRALEAGGSLKDSTHQVA